MIQQNFSSITKIKKNNYNFDITELSISNPNETSRCRLKALSNSISIDFTDNDRENIKECVKLMKKITRLYIPIWKFLLVSQEYSSLTTEKKYPYFYIKFKCLFNHYNNITKLPNGTYFYSGIKDFDSYLELSPSLCDDIDIADIMQSRYFGSIIYVPFTNVWFEELKTLLENAIEVKDKIEAIYKLFSYVNSYTPKFLLYQKDIKKYIIPLKSKSSKNTILMYNLINYMSVDNFVKHSI